MKQKFPRGTFVRVAKNLPPYMNHFEKDFIGVVEHTYGQKYGGGRNNYKEYCILMLNKQNKPINSISWYEEDQLTRVNTNTQHGKDLIEEYYYGTN